MNIMLMSLDLNFDEYVVEVDDYTVRFYDINMNFVSEPGLFNVFIGHDSDTQNMAEFLLV